VTSPELKPRTVESSSARRFAAAIRMSTFAIGAAPIVSSGGLRMYREG
jgi:hypothetical protein